MLNLKPLALSLALLFAWQCAHSAEAPKSEKLVGSRSNHFLAAHKDILWRRQGMEAYNRKNYKRAMENLMIAARYGDKPSQAMIAEMYWNGTGVSEDRALAYAWMDLAAERHYTQFVAKREFYWQRLTATQQQEALSVGQGIYAKYGDQVAVPRIDRLLTRANRDITGTRVGQIGRMRVLLRMDNGEFALFNGYQVYQPDYWRPKQYHQWKDAHWEERYGGDVTVGKLRQTGHSEEPSEARNDDL